ncbi:MAG: Rossmann fold domain-containing protein, partial [Pseudomonadota bacterium]
AILAMQHIFRVGALPDKSLDANQTFVLQHLDTVTRVLEEGQAAALAMLLPVAGPDHDDWREALALDLARKYAPIRVNVVAASDQSSADETLAYLRDAPGVTGQYLKVHE